MTQALNGRRGAVFSTRITEDERTALEAMQRKRGGPRALGRWLVWRALEGEPPRVEPKAPGRHSPGCPCPHCEPARALDGLPPGRVVPSSTADGNGDEWDGGNGQHAPRFIEAMRATDAAIAKLRRPPLAERLILDLCGGSGSWSAPYREAGYPVEIVTLPDADVCTYVPPANVWGVLAAPPCDQFSLARNGCETPRDFARGMAVVNACMRIVLQCKPQWWALENPSPGLLSKWIGTARDIFEPFEFGDPWTKPTGLWGAFAIPKRGPFVRPLGAGPHCVVCDPSKRATIVCNSSAHRAITPGGFARAFFEANP